MYHIWTKFVYMFYFLCRKKPISIHMEQPDEQQIEDNKPKSSAGKIYLFIVLIYLLVTVLYLVNRF
jgi:hypothetical protein